MNPFDVIGKQKRKEFYYVVFEDETTEDAIWSHSEPFNSIEEARTEIEEFMDFVPYVVINSDRKVVWSSKDQE